MNREINVYLIANTQVNDERIFEWLNDQFDVEITNDSAPGADLTRLAGRRCYLSYDPKLNANITKIRESLVDYIDNILASGHGSVLEHTNYTFAIENVTRVFTGEMNRHRAGVAISEGSMRYIRPVKNEQTGKLELNWWLPYSLTPNNEYLGTNCETEKVKTIEIFNEVFDFVAKKYSELEEIWDIDNKDQNKFFNSKSNMKIKKRLTSLFRRIIPMGICTGGIWTFNLRALRHVLTMRGNAAAEEEICNVANKILDIMAQKEPEIFGDFTIFLQRGELPHLDPKYKKV